MTINGTGASAAFVAVPRCPICEHRGRRRVGRRGDRPIPSLLRGGPPGRTTSVVACTSCHHVYADPAPSEALLEQLYAASAAEYFAHLEDHGDVATIALLEQWMTPPGRLLDVGCGGGRLMQAARQAGWDACGIEPTPDFAERARAHGDVHVGYLDDQFVQATTGQEKSASRFDALTMMAVLEHVVDPVALLRCAREVTRTGGVLVAEVPNAHRPEAIVLDAALRLRGRGWTVRTAPLQSPFHLSEFSRRSMRRLLARTGWDLVSLQVTAGHNPYPVPRVARGVIRAIETVGGRAGMGLNMTIVARAR